MLLIVHRNMSHGNSSIIRVNKKFTWKLKDGQLFCYDENKTEHHVETLATEFLTSMIENKSKIILLDRYGKIFVVNKRPVKIIDIVSVDIPFKQISADDEYIFAVTLNNESYCCEEKRKKRKMIPLPYTTECDIGNNPNKIVFIHYKYNIVSVVDLGGEIISLLYSRFGLCV